MFSNKKKDDYNNIFILKKRCLDFGVQVIQFFFFSYVLIICYTHFKIVEKGKILENNIKLSRHNKLYFINNTHIVYYYIFF